MAFMVGVRLRPRRRQLLQCRPGGVEHTAVCGRHAHDPGPKL